MAAKSYTAKSVAEVRCWVETQEHHKAESVGGVGTSRTHLVLTGHHHTLRIPQAMFKQCFLTPGGEFDKRMYRWDHVAEWNALGFPNPLIVRVGETPQ